MNDLSWLIYWANVAPQLGSWVCYLAFLASIVATILTGFHIGLTCDPNVKDYKGELKASRWLLPLFILLWGSSFLVPNKETFYMIAASEAGERAIQTPEFVKLRAVINTWLDKAAKPAPAPENK